MKKCVFFCFITILSFFNLAADPFSRIDGLYFELQAALGNPQEAYSLLQEIKQEQNQEIQTANLAVGAIVEALPVLLGAKGELAALAALGHNSLYLYDMDRKTLGDGVQNYFCQLKLGYGVQNILSLLGPHVAVNNWFSQVRPALINAGLQAPTAPAGSEFNYDVLTLIDSNVNLLRDLDPQNPLELLVIQALIGANQQFQLLAVDITAKGLELVEDFAPILLALTEERDTVVDPEVLNAVIAGLPTSDTTSAFQTITDIYQALADYVVENGNSDRDGYVALYDQLRPLLIQTSQ